MEDIITCKVNYPDISRSIYIEANSIKCANY